MKVLRDSRWLLSPKKVRIGYKVVRALGHEVMEGKVKPDPDKLDAIRRLLAPTKVKELRAFLGLVGFYRVFIPSFA